MIRSILRWLNAPLHQSVSHGEPFVDPNFGDCLYISSIDAWMVHWQLTENRQIIIAGRSKRPTPEQVALWQQAQERLPQLIREANASIPEPSFKNFTPAVIKRDGLELSEIRFERDGTVELFLDFNITDSAGNDLYPQIIFRDWQIVSSEWCV